VFCTPLRALQYVPNTFTFHFSRLDQSYKPNKLFVFRFFYFQNMSKNLKPLNAYFTAFSSPEEDTDLNECGICSKTLKTKVTLRRHKYLHNEYICRTCSLSFETNRELEDHKTTKHCDTYLCSISGKSFNRRSGLNAHNKLHLERVEVCPFEQCGKLFINKHQLADHLNGHTGNKPHTCRRCKRSNATQPSYSHHQSVCIAKGEM
jgi:hypothetical protein